MALAQSITGLLNRKPQKTFEGKADEDPVVALAEELQKPVEEVRTAVEKLRSSGDLWVRPHKKGELPPAIGLCKRAGKGGNGKKRRRREGYDGDRAEVLLIPRRLIEEADSDPTGKGEQEADQDAPETRRVPVQAAPEPAEEPQPEAVEVSAVVPEVKPEPVKADPPEAVEEPIGPKPAAPTLRYRPTLSGHMPEYLTLVLRGFQANSVPCHPCATSHEGYGQHGIIEAGSCIDLIRRILVWTTVAQAQELNRWLGRLKLRFTISLENEVYRHFVRLDVTEVTAEMIKAEEPTLRRPTPSQPAQRPSDDPEVTELEKLRKENERLSARVAELQPLEKQLAMARLQIASLKRQLEERDAATVKSGESAPVPVESDDSTGQGKLSLRELQQKLRKG